MKQKQTNIGMNTVGGTLLCGVYYYFYYLNPTESD